MMTIRKYTAIDREQVLRILRLNTPVFFAPSEEQDFVEYLERHAQHYFVVEEAGSIVGAGGVNFGFDDGKKARIAWDFLHPEFQGRGIGRRLTLHRIEYIRKDTSVRVIEVRTSQLAYQFYEKLGFKLEKIEKDFWAKGFDLYQMTL